MALFEFFNRFVGLRLLIPFFGVLLDGVDLLFDLGLLLLELRGILLTCLL